MKSFDFVFKCKFYFSHDIKQSYNFPPVCFIEFYKTVKSPTSNDNSVCFIKERKKIILLFPPCFISYFTF